MKETPPFWISTVTAVAPASSAFSSSSLTTDAGRSTTSPAAIRFATSKPSTLIFPMRSSLPFRYPSSFFQSKSRFIASIGVSVLRSTARSRALISSAAASSSE